MKMRAEAVVVGVLRVAGGGGIVVMSMVYGVGSVEVECGTVSHVGLDSVARRGGAGRALLDLILLFIDFHFLQGSLRITFRIRGTVKLKADWKDIAHRFLFAMSPDQCLYPRSPQPSIHHLQTTIANPS